MTTINLFNLKAYSLGSGEILEEYKGLKIESYSTTTEKLRIRFNPGNTFGVQFVEGADIENRKVLNFEHLDKRISVLIVDASANKDKVRKILADNESNFMELEVKKLTARL